MILTKSYHNYWSKFHIKGEHIQSANKAKEIQWIWLNYIMKMKSVYFFQIRKKGQKNVFKVAWAFVHFECKQIFHRANLATLSYTNRKSCGRASLCERAHFFTFHFHLSFFSVSFLFRALFISFDACHFSVFFFDLNFLHIRTSHTNTVILRSAWTSPTVCICHRRRRVSETCSFEWYARIHALLWC